MSLDVAITKLPKFSSKSRRSDIKGKETLRLKSNGSKASIEIDDERTATLIEKVNEILEAFIGIDDLELGEHLLEIAKESKSAPDLASSISNSDLATFLFPDDFIQKLF